MPFYQPMPLGRKAEPFDHSEWIFELKHDGFRALAVVEYGRISIPATVTRSRLSRTLQRESGTLSCRAAS